METVTSWQEIIDNIRHFNRVNNHRESMAYKHFGNFYHWYCLPCEDIFAPSKFIGYRDTTLENYKAKGHGGITQKALAKYFIKLDAESSEYIVLRAKLEKFAESLKKTISSRTFTEGGIYLPKSRYAEELSASSAFYNVVTQDLLSISSEENNAVEFEGTRSSRLVNTYERKPALRAKAIAIHGLTCMACGFNFEEKYGIHGKSFIEVHHMKPLSQFQEEEPVNPKTDMIVVCSNCHRMIHRKQDTPLTLEELRKIIR